MFNSATLNLRARFVLGLARHDQTLVTIEHVHGRTVGDGFALIQQDGARAERTHQRRLVRDEQDGRAALLHLLDAAHATMLEDRVADRQSFVHDQYVGVAVDRDGEG